MAHRHAQPHGRHKGLAPALWVAAAVVVSFISSLVVIVLYLHHLAQLLLDLARYAWPV